MTDRRPDWPALYRAQHAALTNAQVDTLLEQGRAFLLAPVLDRGGTLIFPHAAVLDCGHQVAAAVEAVLACQATRVLVIGVLHAWTPAMVAARNDLAAGADLSRHPLRGLHGPAEQSTRDEWRLDHSLISWRFFLEAACARRSIPPPDVREVYPFLAGAQPTTLPGYDELARWAEEAVVVATADMVHHGIGYGDPPYLALPPEPGGIEMARNAIEAGLALLTAADYPAYLQHCVATRNDARDSGPLLRALRGPLHFEVRALTTSDMSEIYAAPPPTWVAAALVAGRPS